MTRILTLIFTVVSTVASLAAAGCDMNCLRDSIRAVTAMYDARIGVAVILDGRDTVEVNGRREFPMLSVYKFPQALAVAEYCREAGITLADTVDIDAGEMHADTWSPMRDRYGAENLRLPLSELLEYSLCHSDNNACDILFRITGGPERTDSLMRVLGCDEIKVSSTEDEMHRNPYLCYLNRSTPVAMASLLETFNTAMRDRTAEYISIARMMETCATGRDRLVAPLEGSGAVIGHKTGTGERTPQGRLMAVNDCGYVNLSDGRHYAIAVFVADSAHSPEITAGIISKISELIIKEYEVK